MLLISQKGPELEGKKIVVVGAGRSGTGAARLAASAGARVLLLERQEKAVPESRKHLLEREGVILETGEHRPEQFREASLVCLSPGIPKGAIQEALPQERVPPVYSELELAWWFVDRPVVAVTGTGGKTTTVSLIQRMLEEGGFSVFLGGNIGAPLSEYVLEGLSRDILVLEASSFQLQYTADFRPQVAVFLNFHPNHLDHHLSLQEYFQAKLKIFQNQGPEDLAVLPLEMRQQLEQQAGIAAQIQYFTDSGRWHCPALLGSHNRANIEAAIAACRYFKIGQEAVSRALQEFRPWQHRLQYLGEHQGVLFVDDSKGTTVAAQRAALTSFERPVLLLAGGRLKGDDPREIADLIQSRVKAAGVFGECREELRRAWQELTSVFCRESMQEALADLLPMASPGDVVLLAPGTSSFDQYSDYSERGRAFQELVHSRLLSSVQAGGGKPNS